MDSRPAPFTREPFCRSATFPHTVGNRPFQGSLNNPSVCSRCSQPAPDGSPSPLSLRDISPHRGNHPLQGSLNNPSVCSRCSQPAPDGRESPLSLRDISPHCGESPFSREPKSHQFLPENTVKMFKTVFNTCQKVQNSKTLTICS